MSSLLPTPPDQLVDAAGRPHFLWDVEMTLEEFRERLAHGEDEVRAYLMGKLMRQAKPDDVFTFVTVAPIHEHWDRLQRYLGDTREFWEWLLSTWRRQGIA